MVTVIATIKKSEPESRAIPPLHAPAGPLAKAQVGVPMQQLMPAVVPGVVGKVDGTAMIVLCEGLLDARSCPENVFATSPTASKNRNVRAIQDILIGPRSAIVRRFARINWSDLMPQTGAVPIQRSF